MASVLILCPTFDHAETLFASIASVRVQTFTDWEMVVIGDGAPHRTRDIMSVITRLDERIRCVWHPKSMRFGETYRDPIIRESKADVVLQLGDDDLWAPNHIERMLALLGDSDWANEAPLRMAVDGTTEWWPINHGTVAVRSSITLGIPVSAGPNYVAYRRDAYLRLPEGWTCAPPPGPSDAFMWAKFFRLPALSVASTASTTALKFPALAKQRVAFGPEQRLAEIQPWLARIAQPGFVRDLCLRASIRSRMIALYGIHGVPAGHSWSEALRHCGLEPVDAHVEPNFARNGEMMRFPLSADQQDEARLALEDHIRMQVL